MPPLARLEYTRTRKLFGLRPGSSARYWAHKVSDMTLVEVSHHAIEASSLSGLTSIRNGECVHEHPKRTFDIKLDMAL